MDLKSSFDTYRMPDAMWEKIQPLFPGFLTVAIQSKTQCLSLFFLDASIALVTRCQ
jgi:hypothetical protein